MIGITSFTLKEPSDTNEVTLVTVGTTPSITKALFAPKEPEAPGEAKVNVAAFPAASFIVPLFNARRTCGLII